MLYDFLNYLHTIKNNDVYDYYNSYSTFLITNKDLKENILNHRMNFLISYYNQKHGYNNNINKYARSDYVDFYKKNYRDDYLDQPFLPKESPKEPVDLTEDFDKDVRDHYHFITSKPPPEPEVDYDKIDEKFYMEEEEKKNNEENKIDDDYYDDDDYYEEDEYYEDFEDDYYDC